MFSANTVKNFLLSEAHKQRKQHCRHHVKQKWINLMEGFQKELPPQGK